MMADQVLTYGSQLVVPKRSFVHLQSWDGGAPDQGTQEDAGLPNSPLPTLKPNLCLAMQGSRVTVQPSAEITSLIGNT